MASETRAPATSGNPNRDISRGYISPQNRTWRLKLGWSRRREIPIAISIGAEFPPNSHMAPETRLVATSGNPNRAIYRAPISPKIAHGVENSGGRDVGKPQIAIDIGPKSPPKIAQNLAIWPKLSTSRFREWRKWSVGAVGIRHFYKLITREVGNSGCPTSKYSNRDSYISQIPPPQKIAKFGDFGQNYRPCFLGWRK